MLHDRDYYRLLSSRALLVQAVEQGINSEMAIALAEHLALSIDCPRMLGKFTFDEKEIAK